MSDGRAGPAGFPKKGRRKPRPRRGFPGVWDPTGGEPRADWGGAVGGAFVGAFAIRVEEDGTGPPLRALEAALVVGDDHLVTVRDEPTPDLGDRLRRPLGGDDLPSSGRAGFAMAHAALDALVDG